MQLFGHSKLIEEIDACFTNETLIVRGNILQSMFLIVFIVNATCHFNFNARVGHGWLEHVDVLARRIPITLLIQTYKKKKQNKSYTYLGCQIYKI